MASTYLTRTITTSTDNTKFTISVWVKKLKQVSSSYQNIVNSRQSGTTNGLGLWFGDNDEIFYNFGTSSTASSACQTNAKYRDNSGWYHIVLAGDASQSGTDKLKFYVNGEQITSFQTDNRSSFTTIAYDIGDTTYPTIIGRKHDGTFQYDGLMSHFHFIDGTAYQASTFGEYDANGVWKIKTSPSVTYGNNGFFILKDGNSVTDQSGNSNNFTVGGGTLTNTEDNPSNVFATKNPLDQNGGMTFSEGNLTVASTSASWRSTRGTLGVTQGKWYYEVKAVNTGGANLDMMVGWGDFEIAIPSEFSSSNPALTYTAGSGNKQLNGVNTSYGATYNVGDIIGVAFDADNLTVEFFKNGTSQGSISTGWSSGITWTPIISLYGRYSNTKASYNFGNGYFGTTAVSSAGTNASGIGIFEYDVPTGFTALSTKGLNL
jgi:hypothetical protein